MKRFPLWTICLILMTCNLLNAQDLETYFSQAGLSINAYHFNFYGGTNSTSYTYHKTDTICGQATLVYIQNFNGSSLNLQIVGQKVYTVFSNNCNKTLLYDFGLEIGETITEGYYEGSTLQEKYPVILESGEERMKYDVGYENFLIGSWIEGIGDVVNGLIPYFADFEGYDKFICAKNENGTLWVNAEASNLCDSLSCARPVPLLSSALNEFELSIENNSIFASQFEWDFGDGNFSLEADPNHIYEEPGCYNLSVRVSNECFTGNNISLQNLPVCFNDSWAVDYVVDTFASLYVYRYSEELEFIHEWYGPYLYRTTDEGQSWVKITLPPVADGVQRLINDIKMFDLQKGIMVCGHYGAQSDQKAILITDDGGLTWEEKVPGSYFMLRLEINEDGRAWAMGSSRRYYRTFDYGENWEEISYSNSFTIQNVQFIHDSLIIGSGYTGLPPWIDRYLIKSYDNGLTWDTISPPSNIDNWHFFNENLGYALTAYNLAITTDGGLTSSEIDLGFGVRDFTFHNPEVGWLVDETGLIHYTNDGMQSFSISHCNKDQIRQIQAISETEAFIVSSFAPGASNFSDYKKSFDINTLPSDCATTSTDNLEEIENFDILVYPNPVNEILNIELTITNANLILMDVLGEIIQYKQLKDIDKTQLNLRGLPSGLYTLHIYTSEGNHISKKVIRK